MRLFIIGAQNTYVFVLDVHHGFPTSTAAVQIIVLLYRLSTPLPTRLKESKRELGSKESEPPRKESEKHFHRGSRRSAYLVLLLPSTAGLDTARKGRYSQVSTNKNEYEHTCRNVNVGKSNVIKKLRDVDLSRSC